ncbi:DUF4983 domain-containing protein [Pedobacter deserti]|uniref:DUF4983 domain-containing protein n=1 Tax=Pedobacter deserti TaxID=2817382 RepID=UPI00210D427A|nr:DUF4983 domain-containing protein [Pedobacter sp. SYSU D00382]
MKTLKMKACLGAAAMFLAVITSSCNKDFDKVIPGSPDNNTDITYKTPKVLYIIADGARGLSVRDANVPNIKSLLPTSIYTWNSLADVNALNSTNWADMMTGVMKEKHNITTEDFANNKLSDYPVIFKRLKEVDANIKVASFASTAAFKNNLMADADVSQLYSNDDQVKAGIIDYLKGEAASVVVGQFSNIQKAGLASGFDNEFATYKTAIEQFDAQVGEILNTLKSRANYPKENWLVIITSSRGGTYALPPAQDDKTLFSNTNANTFTIFHSASYNQTIVAKPFLGNIFDAKSVRFKGEPDKTQALLDPVKSAQYFNFGEQGSFTVSVKIKKHKTKNTGRGDYYYAWPSILGKRDNTGWGGASGRPGWDICLFYNGWRFYAAGGDGDMLNGVEVAGADFSGNAWHDLTFVVERKADKATYVRLYTDGVNGMTNKLTGASTANPVAGEFKLPANTKVNFDNNAPLRLGWTSGETDGQYGIIDVELAEYKIWGVALSETVIKQLACEPEMDENAPNYDDLVGYWRLDEGSGNVLKDQIFGNNFTLQGTYSWSTFSELLCTPNNTTLNTLVPKNADIPAQILSWFNIARQEEWGIDGRVWISN